MKTDRIYIEINTECNLRCIHCYNQSGSKRENMDIQGFKRIIEFFLTNEELSLQIAGGEPLLHPQINEYLSYLKEIGNDRIKISIITNGLLASEVLTPYLLQENPFSLILSLDGASEKTNKYIRGPGHYEKVVSYMQFLSQQGYCHGKSKMTINRYNLNDIEDFFELCLSYNFVPTYSFVTRSGLADTNWSKLNVAYADRVKAIELVKRLYESNYKRIKDINKAIDLQQIMYKPIVQCSLVGPIVAVRPLIKVNGNVQPCQRLYDDIYSVGNLFLSDPETVFSDGNERFNAVTSILEKRALLLKENVCPDCVIRDTCGCGCPGRAVDESSEIMGADPDCKLRIEEYIKNHLKYLFRG